MTGAELEELTRDGESSFVEFKSSHVDAEGLAREVAAFANGLGGKILVGVADHGSVVGLGKGKPEEWVMNVCRDLVRPAHQTTQPSSPRTSGRDRRLAVAGPVRASRHDCPRPSVLEAGF